MDPRSASSNEDLLYRYTVAWGFAQAAQQIVDYADALVEQSEELTKKEKGSRVDKLAESMS